MKYLCSPLAFLLFGCIFSHAQKKIILKTGQYVKCKDFALVDNVINVKLAEKGRMQLGVEQVRGLLDEDGNFLFLKRVPKMLFSRNYHFLSREVDGQINVYRLFIAGSQTMYGRSPNQVILFSEKTTDSLSEIYSSGMINGKKDRRDALTELLSKDSASIAKLASEDFKYREEEVLNLINNFNVKRFGSTPRAGGSDSSYLVVFRKNRSVETSLTVNDGVALTIGSNNEVVLKLPRNEIVKLCVSSTKCRLVEVLPVTRYLEIEYEKGEFELRNSNKKNAAFYVKALLGDGL